MKVNGKGKYLGKRKIEINQDLDLTPDTEIFITIEDVMPVEDLKQDKSKTKISDEEAKENPLLEIAKHAKPADRTDYSERYHELLGDLIIEE